MIARGTRAAGRGHCSVATGRYGRGHLSESGCAASDDECGLGDGITVEFTLTQNRIDPLGKAPPPGFLLDVACLLHEEFLFDTVDSLLPLFVDVHPAIRQLMRLDLLGVESLVPLRPHQFLDLLPVPHKERGAILERRRCAVALAESLRGWIPILAPQFQLASASCPSRRPTTRTASRDSSGSPRRQ